MLTKFRNFADRLSSKFADWLLSSRSNFTWTKDDEIAHLEKRIRSYVKHTEQTEIRIQALTDRNTELEQANENLLIQRMEVRKLVEQLLRHFPSSRENATDN